MVSSTKHLALGLRHFATLECFQSLLLFIDDNKLWYDQAGLQTQKTYFSLKSVMEEEGVDAAVERR